MPKNKNRGRKPQPQVLIKDEAVDQKEINHIIATYAEFKQNNHATLRDVQIENLEISQHGRTLLQNSMLQLSYGQRQGLVGMNGSGKTTLLKAIGQRMIAIPENILIHQLNKEYDATDQTALEVVLQADDVKQRLEREADELSTLLCEEEADGEEISERLATIQEELEELEQSDPRTRACTILAGLQFSPAMMERKTREFSGGWRMRISLAIALFMQPTLLLLDEPTNHLDMEAVVWLEHQLSSWKHCLVVISHSQDFLNNVCTKTIHLHQSTLNQQGGNQDAFIRVRNDLLVNQKKIQEREQEEIRHMKDQIARFGHGSAKLARQAQSKEKTLAKMMEKGLTEKVVDDYKPCFKFLQVDDIPMPALDMQNVSFGQDSAKPSELQKDLSFAVNMDSRVALVGMNGVGKTTLLNIMDKSLEPTKGVVEHHPNLVVARQNQHLADLLPSDRCPLEWMISEYNDSLEEEVRNSKRHKDEVMRSWLSQFGVMSATHLTPIGTLSDGQKTRVALAWMAHKAPHILLLDEPTNHLDIDTIDALATAINRFNGGVVLVSHDMRLISQVANEIWECRDRGVHLQRGEVLDYRKQLKRLMKLK